MADKLRELLDEIDREEAFKRLVELVAEFGWLTGRPAEEVTPRVLRACYQVELSMGPLKDE